MLNKLSALLLFLFSLINVYAQTNSIAKVSGVVKDENGKAIPYATVTVKGENNGASTDKYGVFTINAKDDAVLVVGSVGYTTTQINITANSSITVTLKKNNESLKEVSVSAKTDVNASRQPTFADQQAISHTLQDFTMGANITSAPSVFYSIQEGGHGPTMAANFNYNAGSGRIYTGGALPVFMPLDATRGRRYLFDKWVPGSVINESGAQIKNDKFLFNFDKLSRTFLLTQDQQNVIELNMDSIAGFVLKNNDQEYVFQKITIEGKPDLYLYLAGAKEKYLLYKRTFTKFVKANYVNTGLTENGNNYDEYVDTEKYILYSSKEKTFKTIELKKKSVKAAFGADEVKASNWLSSNSNEINEASIVNLVNFLNN